MRLVAVLYTDGSAKPNPGYYGGSGHGYIYDEEDTVDKRINQSPNGFTLTNIGYITNEQNTVLTGGKLHEAAVNKVVSISGSLKQFYNSVDELRYLKTVPVKPTHYLNGCYSGSDVGTNNIGELMGVIHTLGKLTDHSEVYDHLKKVILHIDSEYVIGLVNKCIGGQQPTPNDGFPNYVYRIDLYNILLEYTNNGIEICVKKILAHSGELGNELADRLAFLAMHASTVGDNIDKLSVLPAKGYWNYTVPGRHPFLLNRQIFFAGVEDSAYHRYYVMKYSSDMEPGRKTGETLFGLIITAKQQEYIDSVLLEYQKHLGTTSIVSTVDLNQLYSQFTSIYYEIFGASIYEYNKRNGALSALGHTRITAEVRPAGLANEALSKLSSLQWILEQVLGNVEMLPNMSTHDITNLFFVTDTNKNKKVTKCILSQQDISCNVALSIDSVNFNACLELGIDMPERNHIKRLETLNPNITLVCRKDSEYYIQYYVVISIDSTDGDGSKDVSIWHNPYSSEVYLSGKHKNK